jgi:serine/threonine protein kinase
MTNLQSGHLFGPYKIINQIGAGGMATVYKAYQASMDRYVALKVLPHKFAHQEEFLGRFEQEIKVIAKLEHPHILPVYDCGESEGVPYLVMRYLDAGTLKDHIRAGNLSLAEIDRFFSQFADALGYAHEQGVIHRDIKPTNAMVNHRGDIFLTDFGIAKLIEGSAEFTASGALVGTPAYMSPEQGQGSKVDHRSDIYSLGVVLYEMLTGNVPYEAETPVAVILKKIQEPLPPPSTVNPEIAPAIEKVLLKALSKDAEDRFDSAKDFLVTWKKSLAEQLSVTQSRKKSPLAEHEAGGQIMDLPPELQQALESPFSGLRAGVVNDLNGLLYDSNPGLANAAYTALRQLGDDQSKTVSEAASKSLEIYDRAQRQLRLTALYEQAQMAIQAEDWSDAYAALEELVAEEADYKDASEKLKLVETKIEVARLYNQAKEHLETEQWQDVIDDFSQIKIADPEYQDPEEILSTAKRAITTQKNQEDIASMYAMGQKYFQERRFELALNMFQRVQVMDGSYKNTQGYIQAIRKETTRQKRSSNQKRILGILLGGCGIAVCLGACIFIWLISMGY